jgi:hypothetical protein
MTLQLLGTPNKFAGRIQVNGLGATSICFGSRERLTITGTT